MADNTERITVEVDGTSAAEGFGRVKTSAKEADDAVDNLGKTVDKTQGGLNAIAAAAKRAADALTSPAEKANDAAKGLDKAADSADKAKSKFDELQKSIFGGVRGGATYLWDVASDGMRMAIGFADTFIDKISAVQRTISLLSAIPNSTIGDQFKYLTDVANRYGLSLDQLQTNYARFVLSAQNSRMTNEDVRRSFEQIAMTVRTLHMNTQQAQFTFLALEEMMSKGRVSMQQLNRQFAIRIPGAMDAIAREIGVTTPILVDFLTKTGAAADKMMPQITNALQRLFQGGIPNAAEALDAQRNRLSTSMTLFFKSVLDFGGADGMSKLLQTINGLLHVDTVAEVFANAMNTITGKITAFLKSLSPQDIDSFAKKMLDFLTSFTVLTMAAAQAVIYLGKHLPEVAAAFGAFAGARLGALVSRGNPLITIGGAVIGGGAAYLGAKMTVGASSGDREELLAEYNKQTKIFRDTQDQLDAYDKMGFAKQMITPNAHLLSTRDSTAARIKQLEVQINALDVATFGDRSSSGVDLPQLDPVRKMLEGSEAQIKAQLAAAYGLTGKAKPDHAEEARVNFMRQILGQLDSIQQPEEAKFARMQAQATKLGISGDRTITADDGTQYTFSQIINTLQSEYNKKQQEASDKKTGSINRQFEDMNLATQTDIAKFGDKYDLTNLQQVDDQSWATKARKMGTELESALAEETKKMQSRADLNPLYAFAHPDIQGEIQQLRNQGNAYIDEFKRIEAEKRTALGGEKAFLKDWMESANNFGKITQDFLKGVTDGIVDMLTTMVTTGKLSFSKLTEYVLTYITKMLIVQAITPFMNTFAGALTSGLSSILNVGSSAGTLMFNGQNMLPARASGGDVWAGQPFLVGERGPEVVSFDRPGYVHPNESLRSGGGSSVNIQVNVDANGVTASAGGDSGLSTLGKKLGDAVRAVLVDERRPGGLLAA